MRASEAHLRRTWCGEFCSKAERHVYAGESAQAAFETLDDRDALLLTGVISQKVQQAVFLMLREVTLLRTECTLCKWLWAGEGSS